MRLMIATVIVLGMSGPAGQLSAQATRDQLTILQRSDVSADGHEAIAAVDVLTPGAGTPWHSHPGAMVGFVSEGTVTIQQDGQAAATFRSGESFIVPAGVPHSSTNRGAVSARMFVTLIVDKAQPMTSPASRR